MNWIICVVQQQFYSLSKRSHLMFGKCGQILKILSPINSYKKFLCAYHKDFHHLHMLLHYLVKFEIQQCYWFWPHRQKTADMFLQTLWSLDLTLKLDRLSQDCSHWLTDWHFEVYQTTARIDSWTLFSWTLLHHGVFFTMIIFAPSSSRL